MSRVVISLEFRFYKSADNKWYTDSVFGPVFWQRYLAVFDEVIIVARVNPADQVEDGWIRVDGERIKFCGLPYYIGPAQMVRKLPQLLKAINQIAKLDAHFILRVPSILGALLSRRLQLNGKPYAIEVVGDPGDVFTKDNFKSKLVKVYNFIFSTFLIKQCKNAKAVAYVTKSTLQQKYPPNPTALSTNYSSIEMSDYFYSEIKSPKKKDEIKRLLFIGSLSQTYKGLHVLLDALGELTSNDLKWKLDVIGDGSFRNDYEQQVERLDLKSKVQFHGYISDRKAIYEFFRSSDLFVLPSLTEGLPRVVIEAMATGLPVVASRVGGVPELIEECALVAPGNPQELREKIELILNDDEFSSARAKYNREESESYRAEVLQSRREKLYSYLINEKDC